VLLILAHNPGHRKYSVRALHLCGENKFSVRAPVSDPVCREKGNLGGGGGWRASFWLSSASISRISLAPGVNLRRWFLETADTSWHHPRCHSEVHRFRSRERCRAATSSVFAICRKAQRATPSLISPRIRFFWSVNSNSASVGRGRTGIRSLRRSNLFESPL